MKEQDLPWHRSVDVHVVGDVVSQLERARVPEDDLDIIPGFRSLREQLEEAGFKFRHSQGASDFTRTTYTELVNGRAGRQWSSGYAFSASLYFSDQRKVGGLTLHRGAGVPGGVRFETFDDALREIRLSTPEVGVLFWQPLDLAPCRANSPKLRAAAAMAYGMAIKAERHFGHVEITYSKAMSEHGEPSTQLAAKRFAKAALLG